MTVFSQNYWSYYGLVDPIVLKFYEDFGLRDREASVVIAAKKVLQVCLHNLSEEGVLPCGGVSPAAVFSEFESSTEHYAKIMHMYNNSHEFEDFVVNAIPELGIADGNPYESVYIWFNESFEITSAKCSVREVAV